MTTLKVKTLEKVVRIGTNDCGDIYCKIAVKDERLSITGVEGPRRDGNARGGCGQINMHLAKQQADIQPAPGWTAELMARFFEVWDRWHLNDMRAGSKAQETWLRENPIPEADYAYPKSHYDVACSKLAAAGLNPDPSNGYKYGHSWNMEPLPSDVIDFLASLPDTDKNPAWV